MKPLPRRVGGAWQDEVAGKKPLGGVVEAKRVLKAGRYTIFCVFFGLNTKDKVKGGSAMQGETW